MMTCERAAQDLTSYLYDEVDPPTRSAVDEHVAGCDRCARELDALRGALGVLRSVSPPQAPPGFKVSIPRRRAFPRLASLAAASVLAAMLLFFLSDGTPKVYGDVRVEKVSFSLTVYNDDLALVRDRRNIFNLRAGRNTVRFSDVPSYIDPTSVHFFSMTDSETKVVEQNFEFDLVSADKLLRKFVDGPIECVFKDGSIGKGTLLSFDHQSLVVQRDEIATYSRENIQSVRMPKLPEGLLTRPTLVWVLEVKKEGKHETTVSYLTRGMAWRADYTANVGKGDVVELSGWVTVNNNSGATFDDAQVKLIAGDVNRVRDQLREHAKRAEAADRGVDKKNGVEEQTFFEYHMYTLGRKTNLTSSSVKQVEFLRKDGIQARRVYEFSPQNSNNRVGVKLEFKNEGMPLPMGQVRLFAPEFVRAVRIEHTPKDEKISLFAGYAFDLVAEYRLTRVETRRRDYEVKLRNHKDEDVTIAVIESVGGNAVVESPQPHERIDAYRIRFSVAVPKHSEKVFTYRVDYP